MKARNVALLLTAALVVYFVLLADHAIRLLRTGSAAGAALGAAMLVLPLLGAWIVFATWRSGVRIQRLGQRLDEEGGLPDASDLPRRPSGRVDRAAADAWFEQRRGELEQHPDDWRHWYRLAYAYDIAGDRRRARATMRKALELEETDPRTP